MPRSSPHLFVFTLIAVGVFSSVLRADETYRINLSPPAHVGQKLGYLATETETTEWNRLMPTYTQPMAKSGSTLTCDAQVDVTACDPRGMPTQLKLKVKSLRGPGRYPLAAELIEPGTEAVARSALVENDPPKYADVFAGNDGPVHPAAAAALRRVITLGAPSESTEQQAFGPETPQPIGGTWKLDGERGAHLLAKMKVDADAKNVTGVAQLVGISNCDSVECLEVRLTVMCDDCKAVVPAGQTLLRANATGHLTYYLEKSTGRIVETKYDVKTYTAVEGKKGDEPFTDRRWATASREIHLSDWIK